MEMVSKYKNVISKITTVLQNYGINQKVKVLVVSKKRPIEQILEIYNQGHRDFGENYVKEILEKSQKLPSDINWHLIGHLQTNKVKKILSIKNLYAVESVDNVNLAVELNNQCIKLDKIMNIYIQINISRENTKSGVEIENVEGFVDEIKTKCDRLKIVGIMSLGNIGNVEEFKMMNDVKNLICNKYSLNHDDFFSSYGTSDDFEQAILNGSNEVRLGGVIFDV
jgi:pyridoxal phosphate enzyme (YggS family)